MRVDWCVSSWFRMKNTHSHPGVLTSFASQKGSELRAFKVTSRARHDYTTPSSSTRVRWVGGCRRRIPIYLRRPAPGAGALYLRSRESDLSPSLPPSLSPPLSTLPPPLSSLLPSLLSPPVSPLLSSPLLIPSLSSSPLSPPSLPQQLPRGRTGRPSLIAKLPQGAAR